MACLSVSDIFLFLDSQFTAGEHIASSCFIMHTDDKISSWECGRFLCGVIFYHLSSSGCCCGVRLVHSLASLAFRQNILD